MSQESLESRKPRLRPAFLRRAAARSRRSACPAVDPGRRHSRRDRPRSLEHPRIGAPAHRARLEYGLRRRTLAVAVFPARSGDRRADLAPGAVGQGAARPIAACLRGGASAASEINENAKTLGLALAAIRRPNPPSVCGALYFGGDGLIRPIVARTAAAMPPTPPVQRKPVRRPVIAVRPIAAALAIRALAVLRCALLLRLTAGNE